MLASDYRQRWNLVDITETDYPYWRNEMFRNQTHFPSILLLAVVFSFAQVGSAEIYKWVDEDGNVHFGDKPRDSAQATDAKPVELEKGYQPPERTEAEKAAIVSEQQQLRQQSMARQQEEQKTREEENSKRREEKAERCAFYEDRIKRLTTVEMVNGRRQIYYATTEDGKSVSSEQQREIVEDLRKEKAAAGCP